MSFRWPWRSREHEPVSGFSTRLDKAMGDPAVSAVGGAILARSKVPAPAQDPVPRHTRLQRLAEKAFESRREVLGGVSRGSVVDPAVPLLYVGDREAYVSSPLRIVTVGLNPARSEFPSDQPFRRFPLADQRDEEGDGYFPALDTYFETDPDKRWYSSFESLLNGLDASYYPGERSTALHTYLCSPVATEQTWGKLDAGTTDELAREGVPLWHDLVVDLRPDVILVSVARTHLEKIEFVAGDPFEISRLEEEDRRQPYVTEGRWLDIGGHRTLMAFGQASHLPFGLVSNMHKIGIGGRIATHLRARDESRTQGPDREFVNAVT